MIATNRKTSETAHNGSRMGIFLPVKICLTKLGIRHFTHNNQKYGKLRFVDHAEELGIQVPGIQPKSMQKMIYGHLLSKVEASLPNVTRKRQEVIDLTKLITYGLLYKHLDSAVYNQLIRSEMIKTWNRHHPKLIIDQHTNLSGEIIAKAEKAIAAVKPQIEREIFGPALHEIGNWGMSEQDYRIVELLVQRMMDIFNPLIWFILASYRGKSEYIIFIKEIQKLLISYVKKSRISDYLGFMIIELLLNVENDNLAEFIRDKMVRKEDRDILNPVVRFKLLSSMESEGKQSFITWQIDHRNDDFGNVARLHISISNRYSHAEKVRSSFAMGSSIAVKEKSLSDYYADNITEFQANDLGLYYLSFLNDACKDVGIYFKSTVTERSDDNLTALNLFLKIL